MGMRFMILDYTRRVLITSLTSTEVCAIAKALMQMPSPSFDIVGENKKFVTSDFIEKADGCWHYVLQPQVSEQPTSY